MPKNAKTPEIRFAGFTDAWEERKLAELAAFSKGQGYSKGDLRESGMPIILYGRLYTKYETVISDVNTFVAEKDNSVLSKGGEVIVPASGETAEDISRASVVENAGIILGGDLNVLKPNSEIDSVFLAITISNGTQQKDISKRAQGKSVVHIHNSDLKEVRLHYPKLAEQEMIGATFASLDRLITLHQREHDKTVNIKKAMLEKMFPKEGADKPEIRFAGFTDAWEKRKLGELAQSFEYGLNAAAREYDGENKYLRITDIDDETHEFNSDALTTPDVNLSKAENYKLQESDVLFARTGASVGKTYRYKAFDGLVYFAGFLIRARIMPEYDSEFVYQNTLTSRYARYIAVMSQRSGQPGVNAQEYSEFTIAVPDFLEQRKLGAFFSNLDNLIALHRRELEKLQNMKRALLEKMFV